MSYSTVIHSFPTKWCLTHYLSRLQYVKIEWVAGLGGTSQRKLEPDMVGYTVPPAGHSKTVSFAALTKSS